jgi:predicted Zn-dependent protease with MMP-like domain
MLQIHAAEFEELVAEALDSIPEALADLMDNVVILQEDEAPDDEPELLGLYEGVPLVERGVSYVGADLLPDTITIFRLPILRICETQEDVVREVRVTVVHEIAHHFGIDDNRLHELGWG